MKIHISMKKDRVVLAAAFHPELAAACKTVAGASWSKVNKTWSFPLTMYTLRALRAVFGQLLVVAPDLHQWARREEARETRLRAIAAQDDAGLTEVPRIAPGLSQAMAGRTYQRVAARWAKDAGSFLIADEPGLGKTATALACLMEMGAWYGVHLIVAPKVSLNSVWGRQIEMWTGAKAFVMPEGKARRVKTLADFDEYVAESGRYSDEPVFLVVNPAMLRRKYGHYCKVCDVWDKPKGSKVRDPFKIEHHLEGHKLKRAVQSQDWPDIIDSPWVSVIVDESHEAFAAYSPANITMTTQGLLDLQAKHKIALTGTPLRGEERRIWGTLDWLGHKTGGYWGFMNSYFEVVNGFFGSQVHGLEPTKAKEFYRLLDRWVLRRTRAEVRPDLPLGQRIEIKLDMDDKHRRQYEEFRDMGETAVAGGTIASQGMLSELTRLSQMSFGLWADPKGTGALVPTGESVKLEWLVQWLRERGVTGGKDAWLPEPGVAYKYVISSRFTQILDLLQRELTKRHIDTLAITGDVTGRDRDEAMRLFQSDDTEHRVMLINTKAGGVAIELDAWCDEMVIIDETFVADDQVQLEGRINNRSGRVSPRSWYYLMTADTADEAIHETNLTQHGVQHAVLDKRRGVTAALHLIQGKVPSVPAPDRNEQRVPAGHRRRRRRPRAQ
jgi:SNF2 family DNA or RNA helicase